MQTKLDFKIQNLQKYEVIGYGKMISTPCQIGEWWVTPAQNYKGKIPVDIQRKLLAFLNNHGNIKGVLIAEDMREITAKRELEAKKQEARKQAVINTAEALGKTFKAIGMVLLALIALPFMIFDPMLVVITESEEWVCIGTWYD